MQKLKLQLQPVTRVQTIESGVTSQIDVELFTNNDNVLQFNVVDEDGDAADISAYTTRTSAFYPLDSGTAVFSPTPAFVTDGTNGQVKVTLTPANTSALTVDTVYRFELQLAGTGLKWTAVRGHARFKVSYAR